MDATTFVEKGLRRIYSELFSAKISELRDRSMAATAASFPFVYKAFAECRGKCGVAEDVRLFISPSIHGINAISLRDGRDVCVFIGAGAISSLSEEELRFILGHELGHIGQGHLIVHLLGGLLETANKYSAIIGSALNEFLEKPIKEWCRNSELIADRHGYICSGSLSASLGVIKRANHIEHRYSEELLELYDSYPVQNHRLRALEQYANEIITL